ncbi:MAG: hypothetical protein DHS20C14_20530 [Phycisphaeraceae bacterium]|nr:MAG: hypothetical protein DHS20C14_20530 [Phycisphaeraceae bacterium]
MSAKVSEKTLELNVGALFVESVRAAGARNVYLRGLTQAEERRRGVDSFLQLPKGWRTMAFQFKAPMGARNRTDSLPYRFRLNYQQHVQLAKLAAKKPDAVYYVLPFYLTHLKLFLNADRLGNEVWLLRVADLSTDSLFPLKRVGRRRARRQQTRTIRCVPGVASYNPEHELIQLSKGFVEGIRVESGLGIGSKAFLNWYQEFRKVRSAKTNRRSPQLARGLRVAIFNT